MESFKSVVGLGFLFLIFIYKYLYYILYINRKRYILKYMFNYIVYFDSLF